MFRNVGNEIMQLKPLTINSITTCLPYEGTSNMQNAQNSVNLLDSQNQPT